MIFEQKQKKVASKDVNAKLCLFCIGYYERVFDLKISFWNTFNASLGTFGFKKIQGWLLINVLQYFFHLSRIAKEGFLKGLFDDLKKDEDVLVQLNALGKLYFGVCLKVNWS